MAIASHHFRRFSFLVLVSLLLGAQYASAQSSRPTIVLMTDFGTVDDTVAICKGVMYSFAPGELIVYLTRRVTPFYILDGGRFLYGSRPSYPVGEVIAAVVVRGGGAARTLV